MNPYAQYQATQSYSWTRIDMLILVYNQAVATLNEGATLLAESPSAGLGSVQLKAMRTLLAIAEGLNLAKGDLPIQVLRLVVFAIDQVATRSPEAWRSAAQVMDTLRAGFLEIQDQARKDEFEGRIPALDAVG